MSQGVQGLYAIVDLPHPHGLDAATLTRAVLGNRLEGGGDGASVVQLRAKHATTEQRVATLRQMSPLCREAGVPLIMNDDLDAALEAGADGVHLGQDDPGADDPPSLRARAAAAGRVDFVVGLSTHDLGQLRAAGRRGPDYLALGPIAPTRSKQDPEAVVGLSTLLDGARLASRPLVAIGGMNRQLGARTLEAGAAAVAVIGALVFDAPAKIQREAIALSSAFERAAALLSIEEVHRRIPVLSAELLADLARWGDSLGTHVSLGLPARFAPRMSNGQPCYRPCDVLDLMMALGKHPAETWEQWRERDPEDAGPIVQLRLRS